jgi:hypothetical protein
MAEINIIKIEGKPLEKLIDVISKGVGTVYRPKAIRKEAEARAYEIEILKRATAKATAEGKEIDFDSQERIQERILHKETRHQINIDNVSQIAAEHLYQEESVSNEPVNEDWIARFFSIVEDISDEELQNLWGRILAGEVKQPNSYSLRTLEVLKNLTKREAEIFIKFSKLAMCSSDVTFVFNPDNSDFLLDNYGITFQERLLLEEVNLIKSNDLTFQLKGQNLKIPIIYGKAVIILDRSEGCPQQDLPVLVFTKIGTELLKLIDQTFDLNYANKLAIQLKNEKVDVSYGLITERTESNIRYTLPLVNLPIVDEK